MYIQKKSIKNSKNQILFLLNEDKYKTEYGEGLKVLTPKQMLQKLPIALAHVKAGNNSEHLLNKIRQIVYCLY